MNINSSYAEFLILNGLGCVTKSEKKDGFVLNTLKWVDIDGDVQISKYREKGPVFKPVNVAVHDSLKEVLE